MVAKPEDFWRSHINQLRGPFPEAGVEPPLEESIGEVKTINGLDPATLGNFTCVTMDIYFFMDAKTNKYFLMQNQKMIDLGEMSLERAAALVKRRQKRK